VPESDLEFVMKDGNVIKIASYKSIYFYIEPEQNSGGWDMEKTLKFGGASYGLDMHSTDDIKYTSVVAVAKDYVIADLIFLNSSVKVLKKDMTYANFWNFNGKLAIVRYNSANMLTMSCSGILGSNRPWISFYTYINPYNGYDQDTKGRGYFGVEAKAYDFNGDTNVIPTTITLASDGGLIMEFTDYTGKSYSHKFPAP
jgi:hypothetical protein